MRFNLDELIRDNIKTLVPYSTARDEFSGEASVFLDANENSLGSPLRKWYNRYPDPLQQKLKSKVSSIKGVPPASIFLGNGSDECIDVLMRSFCEPRLDNIIVCPPTYGMYEVSASINHVQVKKVSLTADYQLDLDALESAVDDHTKIIFLCSPNNPTGNALAPEDIAILLDNYFGIVVIDEAYVNFSRSRSFIPMLKQYPQLVVMQTLSKAWGLAALRLGMAFASEAIVAVMNKVKPPYNINQPAQDLALEALDNVDAVNAMIRELVSEREKLSDRLASVPVVKRIFPSDANFLLVQVDDAHKVYDHLLHAGIVVRDRSRVHLCDGCLRITVGTPEENNLLIDKLTEL